MITNKRHTYTHGIQNDESESVKSGSDPFGLRNQTDRMPLSRNIYFTHSLTRIRGAMHLSALRYCEHNLFNNIVWELGVGHWGERHLEGNILHRRNILG